jgi:tetratricopeptide (TPR) repeat protein
MLGFAWLALRQAKDALKHGRLEEAQRLLSQPSAQGRKGVSDLLVALARAYVERGERSLNHDDAEAAWSDLLQAEALQTAEKSSDRLRQALVRLGLAEVRALLTAGETARAEESVARLRQRNVGSPESQVLEEAARAWAQARELADRGEFAGALDAAERARRLLGPGRVLDEYHADLQRRQHNFSGLLVRLHEAADAARWREVVEAAEAVLASAP